MIDMNLTYSTRDGRPVRILCVDGPDKEYPIVGVVSNELSKWNEMGRIFPHKFKEFNPIEVKPKAVFERWVNIYLFKEDARLEHFYSEEEALKEMYTDEYKVLARAIPFRWVEGDES